jgi:hypothetical protein
MVTFKTVLVLNSLYLELRFGYPPFLTVYDFTDGAAGWVVHTGNPSGSDGHKTGFGLNACRCSEYNLNQRT